LPEIAAHDRLKSLLTIPRNTCSRCSEIHAHHPAKRASPGGVGLAQQTSFRIPVSSIGLWTHRFIDKGVSYEALEKRFGEPVLSFVDLHLDRLGPPAGRVAGSFSRSRRVLLSVAAFFLANDGARAIGENAAAGAGRALRATGRRAQQPDRSGTTMAELLLRSPLFRTCCSCQRRLSSQQFLDCDW
jgi:hypothetical protein